MSTIARRPSCLIEGTREYEMVQAGEQYFTERNAYYGYVRRIIRWILDDAAYYGSSVNDMRMMLRTMTWDGHRNPEFKDQLSYLDEYLEIIYSELTQKAKDRLFALQGARRVFGAFDSIHARREQIDAMRRPGNRIGWQ